MILLRFKTKLSQIFLFLLFYSVASHSLERPHHEEWIAKLGAQKISLVFASGYLNSPASSFGHTFLKLSNPKNSGGLELLDYGINYAANTGETEGRVYALYGLFGYFKGNFGLLPYHQMIKEYTNLEGRDLWEYELNFSPEEVKKLLTILLEEEGKGYDYYFLTDNCSYRILWLLNRIRPELEFFKKNKPYVVPIDTVKEVVNTPYLVTQVTYRPSLKTQYENYKKQIQQHEEIEADNKHDLEKLKNLELQILAEKIKTSNSSKVYELSKKRAQYSGQVDWQPITQPEAPHLGPEPRMLGVGTFNNTGDNGIEVDFRLAFQNYLSDSVGSPRWSQLEFFRFNLRKNNSENSIYLNQLTILDIASSASIDAYFRPLSWGIKLGSKFDEQYQKYHELIQMDLGYSADLDQNQNHRIFLGGSIKQNQGFDFGMKLSLLNQWFKHFRSELKFETYQKQAELNLRWNLDKNLEVYLSTDSQSFGIYKYF